MVINKYLGINELTPRAQYYVRMFSLVSSFSTFLLILSNTFFVLYSIDRIGFALTSITLSFSFLVQLLTDYPSGSLGDYIGQRWVLTISYISYGIAFFLMTLAQSFPAFMLIAFFNGFGNAQNSGSLNTWLDNNYKKVVKDTDSERKIYGFSRSRVLTLTRISSAFAFMIGGTLATLISRNFVFGVQGFLSIFLIILVLLVIKDEEIDMIVSSDKKKKSAVNGYFSHFLAGLKFLFSSKAPFFFILGTAFLFGSFAIWGNLILMPLYFGYSGSDSLASGLRTFAFVTGVPISIYIAKLSQRLTKEKASILTFLFVILFYPTFILLTFLLPINNEFNLIGCLVSVIILSGLIPTLFDLGQILRQRIMIDMIPSETRNAVYSLIPTIISVLGIFIVPIAGF
ncbi:MAG: MFS transporter, partial [Candidatus Hodarchaeales archaeon]